MTGAAGEAPAATPAPVYVAFDLEATGLSPKSDRVLEVGAVRYDAELRRVAELDTLVDPGMPISLAVQRLVGVGPDDVRGAPTPAEAIAQLADFCAGAELVTHGGAFDMHFAVALAPDAFARRPVHDTLELARILLPTAETHALERLSRLLGLPHDRPHRALSDAEATGALFATLLQRAADLPPAVLAEMRRVASQAGPPLAAFFDEAVRRPASGRPAAVARVTSPASPPAPPAPAEAGGWAARLAGMPLADAAAAALAPGGPLDGGAAYEYREAQVQMARAVAQTLERRRRLLVEAGTGVGKSLAYLVPLVLWSSRRSDRAVVATHTVNLQEQLGDRDLPRLGRLTEPPVRAAVLKGRSHYISLRRWARFLAEPDTGPRGADLEAIRFKLKLLAWLATTATGDRAELHLAADEEQLWQRVASDREDCLGGACANWATRRCFMVAARQRAAAADLVVVNHSLLLADSERQGQVLAPYAALVVDEAHQLEASATQQLAAAVRHFDVALALERVPARPDSALAAVLARCRDASQRLFGDVKGFVADHLGIEHSGNVRLSLGQGVRDDPRFALVLRSARHAAGALRETGRLLEQQEALLESLQAELLPQPDRAEDEAVMAALALSDLADAIEHVVCRPREGYVTWLELRAEQAELHEAPISVAEPLSRGVYARCDSTILTSATLTVGGSFEFVRSRTGFGESAEELALESPFDYLASALCIVAGGVPPYDDAEHDVVMADLVGRIAQRLEGRTLVLFTGYSPLRRVHALLHERLERRRIAVVGQGLDGTRRQILRSFLDDPRTVLLGTSSFWEGIDIPGERLRCVVIDKLPFPVPTDPLVRARCEGLRDPFRQYMLPVAVLRLRQGFGRLIRGHDDRGVVVLCDDRLDTRDYGEVFLRALPPAEQVRAAGDDVPALVAQFVENGLRR